MTFPKPPNLDQPLGEGLPVVNRNFRTGQTYYSTFRVRHVIMALEGQCPICAGRLVPVTATFLRRPGSEDGTWVGRVGRCDVCWLDFMPAAEETDQDRFWDLQILEREPPLVAYRIYRLPGGDRLNVEDRWNQLDVEAREGLEPGALDR